MYLAYRLTFDSTIPKLNMNSGKDTNRPASKLTRKDIGQNNSGPTNEHEQLSILPKASGVLMIGIFVINVYIGLFDKTLAQNNPTHYYANWAIAVVDLAAAVILFSKLGRGFHWTILSGIAWPLAYILSVAIDIETDLGKPNLWPTPAASYQYLILGESSQGWVLWKYTMPTAISLLIVVALLSGISIAYLMKSRRTATDLQSDVAQETGKATAQSGAPERI